MGRSDLISAYVKANFSEKSLPPFRDTSPPKSGAAFQPEEIAAERLHNADPMRTVNDLSGHLREANQCESRVESLTKHVECKGVAKGVSR